MSIRIGYLLPTRERIMAGQPQTTPLLELAERAERLGFDSVWAGDSLLARPRHEPLTLLAAVASRVPRVDIGTAVLLPALRNPVLLAHQVATLDKLAEGRDRRRRHRCRCAEYSSGVYCSRCAFRKAGRTPTRRSATRPFAVDWETCRLKWPVESRARHPWPDTISSRRAPNLDRRIVARKPRSRRSLIRWLAADRPGC
jgi:Luciferase-like monooxygenase